jgi:hypothetical protein
VWHETRERNGAIKSRWSIVVILLATCLAIPSGASAKPPHPLVKAEFQKRPSLKAYALSKCSSARKALMFYKLRHHTWLGLRGVQSEVTYLFPRGCAHTLWRAKLWRTKALDAKEAYHEWLNSQFVLQDFKVTSGNHAWFKAIEEAQGPYPGTEAWLKSCSASEGGWGRWVPNSDGAPPGGWMQMVYGTWKTMWYGWYGNEGAYRYLVKRGYIVPKSAHSWYSALGQALASAHGYMFGRRGEWHGSGCYLN